MNILITNWHEPYVCLIAKTGHKFDCLERKAWDTCSRPVPRNVTLVTQDAAKHGLYDLRVYLGLPDIFRAPGLAQTATPKIFVMLNMLDTDMPVTETRGYLKSACEAQSIRIAFISEKKRANWGIDGPVIVSGVSLYDHYGYTGEIARILCVGNYMWERRHMMGYHLHKQILRDLPITYVGQNSWSAPARDWPALCSLYRSHRVFLSTLQEDHEDGYNLAMLEAMATGMPVVCWANSTSPIVSGNQNGYISDDPDQLHDALALLLEDLRLAQRTGRKGRRTVAKQFPEDRCVNEWDELFKETAGA